MVSSNRLPGEAYVVCSLNRLLIEMMHQRQLNRAKIEVGKPNVLCVEIQYLSFDEHSSFSPTFDMSMKVLTNSSRQSTYN